MTRHRLSLTHSTFSRPTANGLVAVWPEFEGSAGPTYVVRLFVPTSGGSGCSVLSGSTPGRGQRIPTFRPVKRDGNVELWRSATASLIGRAPYIPPASNRLGDQPRPERRSSVGYIETW
jgi:hypothetical protein